MKFKRGSHLKINFSYKDLYFFNVTLYLKKYYAYIKECFAMFFLVNLDI